jgi:hypothetical protein
MNKLLRLVFAPFFKDDDRDLLKMIVTYSFNGGAPFPLTSSQGIFTLNGDMQIDMLPTSFSDLGEYFFDVKATDTLALSGV